MYLDTLAALRQLGAPLDLVDSAEVYAFTGGTTTPDLVHFDPVCAYRVGAGARARFTVADLAAGGKQLCRSCAQVPPFGLSWLGNAEVVLAALGDMRYCLPGAADDATALRAGRPGGTGMLRLGGKLAVVRNLIAAGDGVPTEIRHWYRQVGAAAAAVLDGHRHQLRNDDSWLPAPAAEVPAGRHYAYLPRVTMAVGGRARIAVAVYSDYGAHPGPAAQLFAVPSALLDVPAAGTPGTDTLTVCGSVHPDDPADLPAVALSLMDGTGAGEPLHDPAAAVLAARGILATA